MSQIHLGQILTQRFRGDLTLLTPTLQVEKLRFPRCVSTDCEIVRHTGQIPCNLEAFMAEFTKK